MNLCTSFPARTLKACVSASTRALDDSKWNVLMPETARAQAAGTDENNKNDKRVTKMVTTTMAITMRTIITKLRTTMAI